MGFKYVWATGYWNTGGVELGPLGALYSHNALEGGRIRLGARTTYDLSHHWRADGYAAYGLLDKKWKYSAAVTYQLNDNFFNNRPQNAFRLWSLNDVEIPGQTLENTPSDNILSSFSRGKFDKMYYKRAFGISYINESNTGKTYQMGIQQRQLTPAGSLRFERNDLDGTPLSITHLTTNEAFVNLRYAPNEEYFQGQTYRKRIVNKYPVFGLHYTYGMGNDGTSSFNYQNVSADVFKRFYIAPIGRTDVQFEVGRVFGKNLPYPLLHVFQANQTSNYEQFAFNQMNYLEFISDKYTYLNIEHGFDGFFLNKIPLIKKLKWREYAMFKAVYGGLDVANNPATNPSVYRFPTDANGQSLTSNFNKQPYMELGVGIGNIFKVFRVDVTRRLNYLNNPNTSKWRVQGEILFDF